MKIHRFARRFLLSVLVAGFGWSGFSQSEQRPVWEQEVMLVYSATSTEFNRLRSLGTDNQRLALYTQALDTLHGKLEVGDGQVPYRVAERLFDIILRENDEDAIGLASGYYLARIVQSNPYEQDLGEAKALYWDLYEQWPERFFGQMAFVKYATLHIYGTSGDPDEARLRIQNLEPMVSEISIPELRQNVHRILGEAYVVFDLEAAVAYQHFLAAYEIGIPVDSIRVDVLERIAALGVSLGERERALRAYDELALIAPGHERAAEFAASAQRLRLSLSEDGER